LRIEFSNERLIQREAAEIAEGIDETANSFGAT